MPTTRSTPRKAPSFPRVIPSAPGETPAPVATAVSTAMKRIANRSSTRSTPTTKSRSRPRTFRSSNALAMMVVLDIATIAPAKTLSIADQPNARPARKPSQTMMLDCTSAVIPDVGPTCTSLRRLNSSPRPNMSRMTPSSESVWTTPRSATSGTGTWGPTMRPARM